MGKHIIIIEDNTTTLRIMTSILEEGGYKVTGLTSLTTFEDLMLLNADMFLIDERLPIVNGHIICIMLKSNLKTRDIPVILTSGYDELKAFATLSNADDFLNKPYTSQELLNLVGSYINKPGEVLIAC